MIEPKLPKESLELARQLYASIVSSGSQHRPAELARAAHFCLVAAQAFDAAVACWPEMPPEDAG